MVPFQLRLCLLALIAFSYCHGQNSSTGTQTDDGTTVVEKSALEKGMEPVFKLYHNFLETVMPSNFYDSNTPFNVDKLTAIVKNKNYNDLREEWKDLVNTFGGFAACIIMGLLFVVAMPIAGVIYCCCYCCCHKCGGSRDMYDPKRASCQRKIFSTLLLVCTTLMLAGSVVMFLSGDLLHRSLQNNDNKGMMGKLEDSLTTMQTFTRNTVSELQSQTDLTVTNGMNRILTEVENAANNTVDRVKQAINATNLLNQADRLGAAANEAMEDLTNVNNSLIKLVDLQTNITEELTRVKEDISTTCATLTQCPDMSSLNFVPTFDVLDKLQAQANKVTTATDINNHVQQAKDEFSNVSATIETTVNSNIQTSRAKVNEIKETLNKEIKELNKTAEPFINGLKDARKFMVDENDTVQDVGDYIWYMCIGLGCAVLIVVLFYYLGLLFGMCGQRPDYQAPCCNRGSGANLLMTGICFSFLFAWLLMLVVILLFSLGGLSYTMACRYLDNGVENVRVFETVLSDGFGWNVSKSFNVTNLTVADMFENCKENQGLYTALNFKSLYNVDNIVNVTEIKKQVGEMTNKTFNIPTVDIMTPELNTSLQAFATAGLQAVDFGEYKDEIDKPLIGTSLHDSITALDTAASAATAIGKTEEAANLTKAATDLRNIQNDQLVQVTLEKVILLDAVNSLETNMDLTAEVNNLVNSIVVSENTFNANKSVIVKDELTKAVTEINRLVEETADTSKQTVKHNIGKCRPIYDTAQGVIDAACVGMLDPANAVWFGLGWCLFFYIPSIIFAALLVGLYRKTHAHIGKREFDDPIHGPYDSGYDGYRGNHEDNIPLASQPRREQANGKYNSGYDATNEGRDAHVDRRGDGPHDNQMLRGAHGGEAAYAQTAVDHHDRHEHPPRYEEVTRGDFYYGAGVGQGGYTKPNQY